jgi:hypothetical protein
MVEFVGGGVALEGLTSSWNGKVAWSCHHSSPACSSSATCQLNVKKEKRDGEERRRREGEDVTWLQSL